MRAIALLLMLAGPAAATSVPRLSLEEAVLRSDQIVQGKVTRSWTAWSPAHEFLWTHYEVEVEGVWKGARAARVTVSEPGGVLDGKGMSIAGSNAYTAGEPVVLFLYRTPNGYLRTVGWSQGKFEISAEGRVRAAAQAATLVEAGGKAAGGATPLSRVDGTSLREFRARVAALAGTR